MQMVVPALTDLSTLERMLHSYGDTQSRDLSVEFELTSEADVHPVVYCALAALATRRAAEGNRVAVQNWSSLPDELRRMGLAPAFGLAHSGRAYGSDPTGHYIAVQQLQDNRSLGSFVTDFVPILHAEPQTSQAVSYVLWELLRNVLEHSGSQHGAFVAADFAGGRVRLGVADAGIGVPASIRRSHAAKTDRDAIDLAFQPGVSGTTRRFGGNETNGGAGLFFMRSMCAVTGEALVMASGDSMLRLEGRLDAPTGLSEALESASLSWIQLSAAVEGTIVGLNLKLDEAESYNALFDQIREVYRTGVRSRQREAKRARFT